MMNNFVFPKKEEYPFSRFVLKNKLSRKISPTNQPSFFQVKLSILHHDCTNEYIDAILHQTTYFRILMIGNISR